jgi:hypothetical protein
MKFNISAFATAFGIWWGGGIFFLTWWLIFTGNLTGGAGAILQLYPGYSVTAIGSVIGLAWGFVDGLVCGGILAWLYNFLAGKFGSNATNG